MPVQYVLQAVSIEKLEKVLPDLFKRVIALISSPAKVWEEIGREEDRLVVSRVILRGSTSYCFSHCPIRAYVVQMVLIKVRSNDYLEPITK